MGNELSIALSFDSTSSPSLQHNEERAKEENKN